MKTLMAISMTLFSTLAFAQTEPYQPQNMFMRRLGTIVHNEKLDDINHSLAEGGYFRARSPINRRIYPAEQPLHDNSGLIPFHFIG